MKKINKKIMLGIVALALLVGAGGYTLYARDINAKVEATQVAYHTMVLPTTDTYNDTEKAEFDALLTERQEAFEKLDVISLDGLQEKFNLLEKKVEERIELERIQKLYADKKSEIEAINIVEGYNTDEAAIFDSRKAEVLKMVEDKVAIDDINEKVAALIQTNTDIETRKATDAAASSSAASNSGYYDDSDDGDYTDYPSTPSTPGGGGGNPSPTVPSPPTPSPGGGQVCKTNPDGSTSCAGSGTLPGL